MLRLMVRRLRLWLFRTGDTLESIVQRINAGTNTHTMTAKIIGSSGAYNIQLETTSLSSANDYQTANGMDIVLSSLANSVGNLDTLNAAANTTNNFTFYLDGGDDLGIGAGDVVATNLVGDDLITALAQQQSSIQINFPDIPDDSLLSTTNFGQTLPTIQIAVTTNAAGTAIARSVDFAFSESASGPTEATVGDTLEDTLDNMVAAINAYVGTSEENYVFKPDRSCP